MNLSHDCFEWEDIYIMNFLFSFNSQLIKLEHHSHSPIKRLQKWINVGFSIGVLGLLGV